MYRNIESRSAWCHVHVNVRQRHGTVCSLPQTSAAAFTKAMLDLEGSSLTPILVSLVNKDASMLEAFGKGASDDIAEAKEALYQVGGGWDRDGGMDINT